MNYLSTEEDRKVATDSIKLIRKIVMETDEFKKYEPEEFRPGAHIQGEEIVNTVTMLRQYFICRNM